MVSNSKDLSGLSVLGCFAHPDDEGFGSGGTLAMLVDRGAQVTLVCATNGDVGEISDPALATPENLHQVRQEELRDAMTVTGIQEVRFLDYRDSGMAGTADNDHPGSLFQAQADKHVERLTEIMVEVKPDLVMTHDPTGAYGHPDHIQVCEAVTLAFPAAVNALAAGDASGVANPWGPRRLYYVCFPRSNFRRMWQRMMDLGIEPPFASQMVDTIGTPDGAETTTLDVSAYVDVKRESLNRHRTQMRMDGAFAQLSEEFMREVMSTEYFTLALPENASKSDDLLAGL
jgi:LmbE family N-acetylglucosaminyl deacetylase